MSQWSIAAKPKDEQDKVNVDLAASGVAYKERLNISGSTSWNEFATTASRAYNSHVHPIHAISRCLSRM